MATTTTASSSMWGAPATYYGFTIDFIQDMRYIADEHDLTEQDIAKAIQILAKVKGEEQ